MSETTVPAKKRLATRVFQSMLKLFPFDFRASYGHEMEEVFDAQRADAERQGRIGVLRLWWDTITGIATTAPREHWEMLRQDGAYAVRMLGRNKGFTIAATLTLALGIGVDTAVFSVVYGVLVKPLPYGQSAQLIRVRQAAPQLNALNIGFSDLELNDYRAQSQTLAQIAEYHSMPFILIGEEPRRVQTGVVSHFYFQMMGVRPMLGRDFTRGDDEHGQGEGVLLLGYRYWQREFGADPRIVGRKFQMNNRPHVVIGVLPPLPGYPNDDDVYMPVSHCPFRTSPHMREDRTMRMTFMFARMKPGVTEQQALAELSTIASRFAEHDPASYPRSAFTARVASLKEELTQNARPTFLVLSATAALVLLIACANVANLMLSRVLRREHELAVRAALGASRVRLMRQLLTESLILSLLGAALGLMLAVSSTRVLSAFAARFTPRADEIAIDAPVLLGALALAVLTGLLFGSVPATSSARRLGTVLRDGGRASRGGRHRLRVTLTVAQVALSFTLLIGAGLLGQSFIHLQQTPGGYDPENVLSARIALNFSKYSTLDQTLNFWTSLFQRIEADPEVISYAAASEYPMLGGTTPGGTPFQILSRPSQRRDVPHQADLRGISAGYLRTVGVPLVAGRNFGSHDRRGSPPVVLVNQSFVRQFFPNQQVLGQRVAIGDPTPEMPPEWAEVVGVVGDVRQGGVHQEEYSAIYVPFEQSGAGERVLLRTTGDPLHLVERLRRAVREIDPHQPVESFQTLEQARRESLANPRLTSMLVGLFSLLALAITATGITGVMALWVSQRRRDIGIRLAIGANPGRVLRLVMGQGLLMVAVGMVVGVAGAYWLTGMIETLLFGTEPYDPTTFTGVAVLLLLCAATACWVPARRAARIDPLIALRAD